MSEYVNYEATRVFWNLGINGQVTGLLLIIMQSVTICWSQCWEATYFNHLQTKQSVFPMYTFTGVEATTFTSSLLKCLILHFSS